MKRIAFGAKRPSVAKAGSIDDWVLDRETSEREPTKRFTIDVPVSLHKRVKIQCAQQNLVMADVMRELLERRFPDPTATTHASLHATMNADSQTSTRPVNTADDHHEPNHVEEGNPLNRGET